MFTGLISEKGIFRARRFENGLYRIDVFAPKISRADLSLGDSVAINGICLTVVNIAEDRFTVEAVQETITRTSLGDWRPGDAVNLERPLTLNSPLDGHIVTGHVDEVGIVRKIDSEGGSLRIELQVSTGLLRYIAEKGSVALDGVSLTVAELIEPDVFTVALVPHTLSTTNLSLLKIGKKVNVEVDILARYIERQQSAALEKENKVTLDRLRAAGF